MICLLMEATTLDSNNSKIMKIDMETQESGNSKGKRMKSMKLRASIFQLSVKSSLTSIISLMSKATQKTQKKYRKSHTRQSRCQYTIPLIKILKKSTCLITREILNQVLISLRDHLPLKIDRNQQLSSQLRNSRCKRREAYRRSRICLIQKKNISCTNVCTQKRRFQVKERKGHLTKMILLKRAHK